MDASDSMDCAARSGMEAKEYWVHLDAEGSLEKYPARQHARRVQEKLGIDEGLIYLAGQPAKNNEDSDMPALFRQRRYFYYLTGCNEPSCHMTYDIQHDTLSLFIPRIDPKRVIWNGRGSTLAEAVERYDVDEVYYVDELGDAIKDWSDYHGGHGSDVYVLHNDQFPRTPGLHAIIDSKSLQPAMNAARMIKDEHEIALIRKANDISSEAHRKVLANILKYKNEAQVEGLFMNVCISHQAKHQAYDPIVASGPNAGTLHYDANNENFEDRQLMCLDAGCEYELYASDITRTFPLAESWPSEEAENIYKLVERMQESCIERLAPGVRYLDLHILAHQIAIDGLLKLGLLHNGTREEIYAAGTSRAFFPHGLGHHVGLEVHDVGQAELMSVSRGKAVLEQVPSLFPENFHAPVYDATLCHAPTDTQSSQLQEGMVVTVEPGIYFSSYALQHFYLPSPVHSRFINQEVLHRYMPVGGVRIEDDILITLGGYENLTDAPKGDAMFDIIRGRRPSFSTAQRHDQTLATRLEEPSLFRAPGCPLQATPQGLHSIKRTATMPNQTSDSQRAEADHRNHALHVKRSMTTDERVQHWRQSQPQNSLCRLTTSQEKLKTMCGSFTRELKHIFIGENGCNAFQSRGLSQCTDCAILVQTLGRLRQNLALSKQGSPTDTHTPQDTFNNPAHPVIAPHAIDAGLSLRENATEPTQNSEVICAGAPPRNRHPCPMQTVQDVRLTEQERTGGFLPQMSSLQDTQPQHPALLFPRHQKAPDCEEPESYYRIHEICKEPLLQRLQVKRRTPNPWDSALKSHDSVPIRAHIVKQKQERRPASNHTDDRDWMA
ncbi:uncharacterized protein M421DRAFT_425999 [Didymella exigua CBS 183.55]|uniref:Xaa-Pro aminopeptidase n=1 Tax=Didymella exigua CBS 183.55 TaxID=1150837 RepID=A0A6A5R501_9PLEO|nr:uncharacterized protein M421DRAFT_425999 [Didymella exigua CBS 183.55]KAF1923191.1 hypothetical protein M421DRAFT_425999 [Didymella exigua CBS 183.55]